MFDSDSEDDSATIKFGDRKDEYFMNFLLTNARSLLPKIDSLVDAFGSLSLQFAAITECWFRPGAALNGTLLDIGIKIIHASRDGRTKKTGGGVALAFDSNSCNFKRRNIAKQGNGLEVLCAVGNIKKITRKVAVFVVYIPPSSKSSDLTQMCELLTSEIASLKVSVRDPIIVISGDFNRRDVIEGINDAETFSQVETGPTRGTGVLDIIYTNAGKNVEGAMVLPPLETETGIRSDHRCVCASLRFPPQMQFQWVVKYTRRRSRRADEAFCRELGSLEWNDLLEAAGVDSKVAALEETIARLTEKHFPLIRSRKRSNEPPWITHRIRRLFKKKCRIYKKHGRSNSWWATDEFMQQQIKESREQFVERTLADGNAGKSFFAATRALAKPGSRRQWCVSDLFVGASPKQVCDNVLSYLGGIAQDTKSPVPMPDTSRCAAGFPEFTAAATAKLLGTAKKMDSRVDGNPLPHLVREFPAAFATPLADIYNEVNRTSQWPRRWKTEHLTIIPKNPNPADLSECRNISCTSVFSKVLENQLLQRLREELAPDPEQYGGVKKCGAEHLLIDLWEEILSAMEGGKSAGVLLGIDFEKAFNRMDHGVCIRELKRLGASDGSVSLVHVFLEDRNLTITVDGCSADPVAISRGSPQGSVLGCLLYCITTQHLTHNLAAMTTDTEGPEPIALSADDDIGEESGDVTGLPVIPHEGQRPRYSPMGDSPEEDADSVSAAEGEGDDFASMLRLLSFKYIDNTTVFIPAWMDRVVRHCTAAKTLESLVGLPLGPVMDELSNRSTAFGMKINAKKTQLLVVSPPNECITSAAFQTGNEAIKSCDRMKLVGFHFHSKPDAGAHVAELRVKFRKKIWMLYHLREFGVRGRNLYRLYCCYVRAILEYCAPLFHSLLTHGQVEILEKMNRLAVRICFGFDNPVETTMAQHGIKTLEAARRIRRCDGFLHKAFANPMFAHRWFRQRPTEGPSLRNRRETAETRATTIRYHNAPLPFLRRRANELGLSR